MKVIWRSELASHNASIRVEGMQRVVYFGGTQLLDSLEKSLHQQDTEVMYWGHGNSLPSLHLRTWPTSPLDNLSSRCGSKHRS